MTDMTGCLHYDALQLSFTIMPTKATNRKLLRYAACAHFPAFVKHMYRKTTQRGSGVSMPGRSWNCVRHLLALPSYNLFATQLQAHSSLGGTSSQRCRPPKPRLLPRARTGHLACQYCTTRNRQTDSGLESAHISHMSIYRRSQHESTSGTPLGSTALRFCNMSSPASLWNFMHCPPGL